MLEVLLTVVPSLCWMLLRCYQLLRAPTDRLARSLNIRIPHTPEVSVQGISPHDIRLRWPATASDESVFFVVLVNGIDAGTVAHPCVRLSHLDQNSLYKIQVLAVNVVSNLRSASAPVFVRTGSEAAAGAEAADIPVDIPVDIPASLDPASMDPASMEVSDVLQMESESKLKTLLWKVQASIAKATRDSAALRQRQRDDEAGLLTQHAAYQRELDEGHQVRVRKGSDLKSLERTKDSLAFRKLKQTKVLKHHESRRTMHASKLSEMQHRLQRVREKADHLEHTARSERARLSAGAADARAEMDVLRARIAEFDRRYLAAAADLDAMHVLGDKLAPLVDEFVEIADQSGEIAVSGEQVAAQLAALEPVWAADLRRELDLLQAQEDAWSHTFRAHLRRHIAMHNSIEAARGAADPAYVPAVLSEYQASINFGGYANALSRSKLPSPDTSASSLSHTIAQSPPAAVSDLPNRYTEPNVLPISASRVPEPEAPEPNGPVFEYLPEPAVPEPQMPCLEPNVSETNPEQTLDAYPAPDRDVYDDLSGLPANPGYEDAYGRPGLYAGASPPHMYGDLSGRRNLYSDAYMQSPVSEASTLYSSTLGGPAHPVATGPYSAQSRMWASSVQANYLEPRSPYAGLSLSPPLGDPLHALAPPLTPSSSMEGSLFNNLMLPSAPAHSIWSNRPASVQLGHTHSGSNSSPIWRDVGKRDFSPTSVSREFSPFADPDAEKRDCRS